MSDVALKLDRVYPVTRELFALKDKRPSDAAPTTWVERLPATFSGRFAIFFTVSLLAHCEVVVRLIRLVFLAVKSCFVSVDKAAFRKEFQSCEAASRLTLHSLKSCFNLRQLMGNEQRPAQPLASPPSPPQLPVESPAPQPPIAQAPNPPQTNPPPPSPEKPPPPAVFTVAEDRPAAAAAPEQPPPQGPTGRELAATVEDLMGGREVRRVNDLDRVNGKNRKWLNEAVMQARLSREGSFRLCNEATPGPGLSSEEMAMATCQVGISQFCNAFPHTIPVTAEFNWERDDATIPVRVVGVIDSKGDSLAMHYVNTHLISILRESLILEAGAVDEVAMFNALKTAFPILHRNLARAENGVSRFPSERGEGVTFTVCLLVRENLYVANAGRGGAVILREGTACPLTVPAPTKGVGFYHSDDSIGRRPRVTWMPVRPGDRVAIATGDCFTHCSMSQMLECVQDLSDKSAAEAAICLAATAKNSHLQNPNYNGACMVVDVGDGFIHIDEPDATAAGARRGSNASDTSAVMVPEHPSSPPPGSAAAAGTQTQPEQSQIQTDQLPVPPPGAGSGSRRNSAASTTSSFWEYDGEAVASAAASTGDMAGGQTRAQVEAAILTHDEAPSLPPPAVSFVPVSLAPAARSRAGSDDGVEVPQGRDVPHAGDSPVYEVPQGRDVPHAGDSPVDLDSADLSAAAPPPEPEKGWLW